MTSYAEFTIRVTKTFSQHIAGADSNAMSRRSENRSMYAIADEQTRAADRGRTGPPRLGRDGAFLANVPQRSKNPFGRPLFQNLQYSDTPTQPLVPMQFTDTKAAPGRTHIYRVTAVNTVGLRSMPSANSGRSTRVPSTDLEKEVRRYLDLLYSGRDIRRPKFV
jgi:hypothetical protein